LQSGRTSGSLYLPVEMRRGLMAEVEREALHIGMTFSSCREGLVPELGVSCDGSHLLSCKAHSSNKHKSE